MGDHLFDMVKLGVGKFDAGEQWARNPRQLQLLIIHLSPTIFIHFCGLKSGLIVVILPVEWLYSPEFIKGRA